MAKEAKTEDRRSSDQDTALEEAFVAGILPEEDRRAESALFFPEEAPPAPEVPPVAVNPNEEISAVRERSDGVKVTAGGHILDVTSVAPKPPPTGAGFE